MRSVSRIILIVALFIGGGVTAQPLDTLLDLAVKHNPELRSLQLEFEAEAIKADQVSQLPDPQLGVGIPALRPETRLGPQVLMVSASQMFPWFGTLKAKEDVVISMSKAKYEKIDAERLLLFNKVKVAYYKLQFLDEKEKVLKDIVEQLEAMKSVSLSKIEAGMASSANVLRIQLKVDELNQMIQKIEQDKMKAYAVINGITQQSWDNIIVPVPSVDFPVLDYDRDAFEAKIRKDFPMISMLEQQKQSSAERLDVNRKMGAPKFGLGLDYAMVDPRTDMMPQYNGRDILIPKLMLTVPLYRKAYKAKEQEEKLVQESIQFSQEQLIADLMTKLVQYKADYDNALLDYNLSAQQINTSQLAYNILLTDYSSDGKGFDDLLQVQMQLLNYQLSREMSKLEGRIAEANIERLTDY